MKDFFSIVIKKAHTLSYSHVFLNRNCFQHMLHTVQYTRVHRLPFSSLLYLDLSFLRQFLRQYTKDAIRGSSKSSYSSLKTGSPWWCYNRISGSFFFQKKKLCKKVYGEKKGRILFRVWTIHIHCPSWWLHTEKACLIQA